jgi:predicted nucleic acid-binding protein
MIKYLLDTSAIIDGLFGSIKYFQKFLKLCINVDKGRGKLFSTALLYYEFNNVLRFGVDELSARFMFQHLLKYKIKLLDLNSKEIGLARDLAFQTNTTFYDSSYHSVALSRDMILITTDQKYYRAAKETGNIQLLSMMKF